uniref:Uncharacterized protein n=1 Tax=Micrurus surinamensis TaxID=129470 RepID=A0A2D4NR16_MICSU
MGSPHGGRAGPGGRGGGAAADGGGRGAAGAPHGTGPLLHGGLLGEVRGQAWLQARFPDRDLPGQLRQPLHRHHLVRHQPLCAAHAEGQPLTRALAGSWGAPSKGSLSPTGKEGDLVEEMPDSIRRPLQAKVDSLVTVLDYFPALAGE